MASSFKGKVYGMRNIDEFAVDDEATVQEARHNQHTVLLNQSKIQEMHDTCLGMGAKCKGGRNTRAQVIHDICTSMGAQCKPNAVTYQNFAEAARRYLRDSDGRFASSGGSGKSGTAASGGTVKGGSGVGTTKGADFNSLSPARQTRVMNQAKKNAKPKDIESITGSGNRYMRDDVVQYKGKPAGVLGADYSGSNYGGGSVRIEIRTPSGKSRTAQVNHNELSMLYHGGTVRHRGFNRHALKNEIAEVLNATESVINKRAGFFEAIRRHVVNRSNMGEEK